MTKDSHLNNLILNEPDWELFIGILKDPIAVNDNLKKAVSQFNKKIQDDNSS